MFNKLLRHYRPLKLQSVTLKGGTIRLEGYFCKQLPKITCKTSLPRFNVAVCAGRVSATQNYFK